MLRLNMQLLMVSKMSELQIVNELCDICAAQAAIIAKQNEILSQLNTVILEDEKAVVDKKLSALLNLQ